MACPACGCKETYEYDDGEEFGIGTGDMQRCAACGTIFPDEDGLDECDDCQAPENVCKETGMCQRWY